MSRDLMSGMADAVSAAGLRPILLVSIDTAGGTVRCWSGIGPLTWNGDTYQGVGSLGGISLVQESANLQADGLTFSLSGFDDAMLQIALAQIEQGRAGKLWLGALDSTGALIADPFLLFEGLTDVPEISEDGQTSTIALSCENRLADLDTAKTRRYTAEDQALRDPTDKGFDFVPGIQDVEIIFGRA